MQAAEISRTGLDVEWRRLELIAQNLANVNSTRTASGQPYAAQRLITGPRRAGFARLMAAPGGGAETTGGDLAGVEVLGIESAPLTTRKVYQPGHPDADAAGYVSYPAIDQVSEMTSLMQTSRIYEANVVAMNAARQMYAKALEIGKRS
jgi:flagellar basal-body rod protein FlgC